MRETGFDAAVVAAIGAPEAIGLAGLALLDSLSVGTLVIPVLMLLSPQIRAGGVLRYVAALAAFYFAIGLALLAGVTAVLPAVGDAGDSRVVSWIQLAAGALLFAASFFVGPGAKPIGGAARTTPREAAARWHRRLEAVGAGRGVVVLALTAGILEIATMAPYLGAMGILASAPGGFPAKGALLAGYVAVMCLPALALLNARAIVGPRAEPFLRRLSDWLAEQAGAAFPWILGLLGWFVAGNAASRLFA